MDWLSLVSCFLGGALAANAVPHFVSGSMGHAFQSPFAKPPGTGLSSSMVNVLWGFFNAGMSYVFLAHLGNFHPRSWVHAGAFGLGALLIGTFSAHHFGQLHGGSASRRA